MVGILTKNMDIVVGAAGSVLVGPPLVDFAGGLIELGDVGDVAIPLVVALLALLVVGKKHPGAATAFAAVQIGQAIAQAFPQLKQA